MSTTKGHSDKKKVRGDELPEVADLAYEDRQHTSIFTFDLATNCTCGDDSAYIAQDSKTVPSTCRSSC